MCHWNTFRSVLQVTHILWLSQNLNFNKASTVYLLLPTDILIDVKNEPSPNFSTHRFVPYPPSFMLPTIQIYIYFCHFC